MPVIKRYPNRKLYDTEAKKYITLEGITELIREGKEVQVIDHKTGDNLTALTLTQIIYEEEKKQSGLLPRSILTGLIRSSGDRLTSLQRSLFSSVNALRQIDDEIKRRIKALTQLGELTEHEGKELIAQLLRPDIQPPDKGQENGETVFAEELDQLIKQRQIPTQEDLKQLYTQLEELAAKLENITGEDA